jgi:hypothetical protein
MIRCEIETVYGSKRLASEMCKILSRRRVQGARDANGDNVHGVVRTLLSFFLPDTPKGAKIAGLEQVPDAVMTVTRLPAGEAKAEAEVALTIDEAGRITDCGPASVEVRDDLAKAVCSSRDQLGPEKIVDLDGNPVRYVTTRKVELRAEAGPARSN